jgi:SAM-dependent methyltransferase
VKRWLQRDRPREAGRLASIGQDYGEAHRRYVERIGEGGERWLRTKPFSVPPTRELVECLRVFSHIVARLGLGVRAQVLDVGCGPGWLSEFLARCGYSVTGIDVSEDMVAIARERIEAIEGPVGEGVEPLAEFHAMPVLEMPWRERFDAAILYDAMHHFHDEVETLRVIRSALVPGGQIFIHEGVRPEPGSEGEHELIAEMEEYGTLESPFDPEYLVSVIEKAGFVQVSRYAALDDLLDVSAIEEEVHRVETRLRFPPMNTVIAFNPLPETEETGAEFAARIEATGPWREIGDGAELELPIRVTNTGRAFWPPGIGTPPPYGSVTVGPYLPGSEGQRQELPRHRLPDSVSPGESVELEVRMLRATVEGHQELRIEAVREGIAWFGDYGSETLSVRLPGPG